MFGPYNTNPGVAEVVADDTAIVSVTLKPSLERVASQVQRTGDWYFPDQYYYQFYSQYELFHEQILGKGIFGKVYVCKNKRNNVRYAVKIVSKDVLNISGGISSLVRECDVGRYLGCAFNIQGTVRMIEERPFEEKDGAYLVMELCEGRDLLTAAFQYPAWTEHKLKVVFKQCVMILAEVHATGVVHGDVKPQNFVFKGEDESPQSIRLVDFGSAQILRYQRSVGPCKGGTKWYWGPEILERKEVGRHTDVWALGCTLCFLLTGNLPFGNIESGFNLDWMMNLIKGNIVGLEGVEGISQEAQDCVRSILVPNIESRPTCEQLLQHAWLAC